VDHECGPFCLAIASYFHFIHVTYCHHLYFSILARNYPEFFEALVKAIEYLEKKYPEISVELMYSLAGQRGRATIQTRYASLADYERIDAEADKDEAYSRLLEPIMSHSAHPVVDQFYRTIQPK
jgi:hypothetical protein